MVDRVLDLTQADAGQLPLEEKPIELAVLLHDAARDHKPACDAKKLEFVVEIAPDVGAINGDARRLRQAVDHLLENGIAYTPEGGRLLLHAIGDENGSAIIVSDNGPGMDVAAQMSAFDRFNRVTGERDGDTALGLGLPLARQFVEAHGCRIELISEQGEGTLVTVELPRT